ncbi:zinc-binding dehydrogenase [Bradyrhizobium sp. sBnM-33]|nr:zinc-binding dehydrogenase [Bradyrhizobium sp. sBnM-33]WOH53257.1 zinc-binding dehydrogenase [Bradyrhizobium sp. sBnM-33]
MPGLKLRANLRPGETLLVHGAAGASGLAAVEIGRALGATIIATASGDRKVEAVKRYGADHAIDCRKGGFRDRVLEITGGRGADVVFDPAGGDVFDESLRCVATLGRLLPMGFASGRIPDIPANIILVKNLTVIGLYFGFYMAWGKTKADLARYNSPSGDIHGAARGLTKALAPTDRSGPCAFAIMSISRP